jgi:DNA repair photolyase
MKRELKVIKGRGASDNPVNRFEGHYVEYEQDEVTGEIPRAKTQLFADSTKSFISFNKSPDVSFEASINPYRGCEHGCVYCYARPYHEYLGFSSGLDFESKIMVKYDAASILRKELRSPKWKPQVIAMSGVTDIYQPVEKKLKLSRACLSVLAEFRNPVGLITKNYLVTRDIDILKELSDYNCASVTLSITSLDEKLIRKMEPRTSTAHRRLKAIEELAEAGIPVGVNVAPIIPGLTDHECADILRSAADAGASHASYIIVRLPYKVKDLFVQWLEQHFPDRADKIKNRLLDMRGGNLNSSDFGKRMKGEGKFAKQIKDLFQIHVARHGFNKKFDSLTTKHFLKTHGEQTSLF